MPAGDRKVPVMHLDGKLDRQEIDKKHEDLFAKFAEQIHIGISATDEEGRIIFWNHTLIVFAGLSAKETMRGFISDVHFRLLTENSRTGSNLRLLTKSS